MKWWEWVWVLSPTLVATPLLLALWAFISTRRLMKYDEANAEQGRIASVDECLELLKSHARQMTLQELAFVTYISAETLTDDGNCNEQQLARLRNIVAKYAD